MPYPCDPCCNPSPAGSCSVCQSDETPPALRLVVSGFLGNDCQSASDFDLDLIIDQESTQYCQYIQTIGTPLGGVGNGIGSCDGRDTSLRVEVTITTGRIEVVIINEIWLAAHLNNTYTFVASGFGDRFDCCDEMSPALSIPFVSETASGSGVTLGHDANTASVTLECMKCEYCTDGSPDEMSVTIGSGSTGHPSGDGCTDAECAGIAGTYIVPRRNQCLWTKDLDPSGMFVQVADGLGDIHCGEPELEFPGPDDNTTGAADSARIDVYMASGRISVVMTVSFFSLITLPSGKYNIHTWSDQTLTDPFDCESFSSHALTWTSDRATRGAACDASGVAVTVTSV